MPFPVRVAHAHGAFRALRGILRQDLLHHAVGEPHILRRAVHLDLRKMGNRERAIEGKLSQVCLNFTYKILYGPLLDCLLPFFLFVFGLSKGIDRNGTIKRKAEQNRPVH